MTFDPLSFFTPEITKNGYEATNDASFLPERDSFDSSENNCADISQSEDVQSEDVLAEDQGPIHILDLPALNRKTPRYIILILLQLLKPEEETNFGAQKSVYNGSDVLQRKNVNEDHFIEAQKWLKANGYVKLLRNILSVQFSPEYFQYLNKILSSSVYQNDDEIIQLTALRISENSGRTARPNFQRRILLKNFEKTIYLNEPALTSDSLGLKTWGSSLVLSEFVVENKELLVSPILELGSGTGLVGITISLLGHDVTLTDLPEILPNLIKNKEINQIDSDCLVLDWTDPSSFIEKKGDIKYKTIVVADPIYSPEHPLYVVNMICQFLEKSDTARVLLQIPIRNKFEKERSYLWSLLKLHNLVVENEKIVDGFDDFGAQKFIYKEIRWGTEVDKAG
jgi:predicted nicotinamide N-methyase